MSEIQDEHERRVAIVCDQSAYEVPVKVAAEIAYLKAKLQEAERERDRWESKYVNACDDVRAKEESLAPLRKDLCAALRERDEARTLLARCRGDIDDLRDLCEDGIVVVEPEEKARIKALVAAIDALLQPQDSAEVAR